MAITARDVDIKFTNNASTVLLADITADVRFIEVFPNEGELFPPLHNGGFFRITVVDAAGNLEIMRVIDRVGNVFTVERGDEGTVPRAFKSGDIVELRLTAQSIYDVVEQVLYESVGADWFISAFTNLFNQLFNTSIKPVNDRIDNLKSTVDWHTQKINEHDGAISSLNTAVGNAQSTANSALSKANENATKISQLQTNIGNGLPSDSTSSQNYLLVGDYMLVWGDIINMQLPSGDYETTVTFARPFSNSLWGIAVGAKTSTLGYLDASITSLTNTSVKVRHCDQYQSGNEAGNYQRSCARAKYLIIGVA